MYCTSLFHMYYSKFAESSTQQNAHKVNVKGFKFLIEIPPPTNCIKLTPNATNSSLSSLQILVWFSFSNNFLFLHEIHHQRECSIYSEHKKPSKIIVPFSTFHSCQAIEILVTLNCDIKRPWKWYKKFSEQFSTFLSSIKGQQKFMEICRRIFIFFVSFLTIFLPRNKGNKESDKSFKFN